MFKLPVLILLLVALLGTVYYHRLSNINTSQPTHKQRITKNSDDALNVHVEDPVFDLGLDDLQLPKSSAMEPTLQQPNNPVPFQPDIQVVPDGCTNISSVIHVGVIITDDYTKRITSLPLIILLKSVLADRQLPLHFHFLSGDSITNKTIHKLLSTWNIPYFKWTIYTTPQTGSIPSVIHGNILLNLLLPPSVKELIVLNMGALIIKDIDQLWQYLQQHVSTRVITTDDFKSNVLLIKRVSVSSTSNILKSTNNDVQKLSANDIVGMFSELSTVVPYCNGVEGIACQVISQQLETGYHQSYNETHYTLMYDGGMEQNIGLHCNKQVSYTMTNKLKVTTNSYCDSITRIANYNFRSLLYFFGHHYTSTDIHDVTLVTQLTFDRVSRLPHLLSHWSGPASIAIYVEDHDLENLYKTLNSSATISTRARKDLSIHVVFNNSIVYPINYIRNVAMDCVSTPYMFLDDFDFLPNFESYPAIKKAINDNDMDNYKQTALVVPAFETVEHEISFPKSKEEMLSLIKKDQVRQFHVKVWAQAHSPTMYKKWKLATKPYKARYRLHYEPYIVVSSDVVRYDTRFVGFGWNKVSHIMELHAQSYKFLVLPNLFVLHMWHPVSVQKIKYFKNTLFQDCLKKQEKDSQSDLVSKYGNFKMF